MSISLFKKALFAGTALVAATAFSVSAYAVGTATLTADTTFASAGTHSNAPNDGTAASAGTNVNTNDFLLAVGNNQTANDGEGLNTFTIGAITGSGTGDGVGTANGAAVDMAVTIASINETGANTGIAIFNAENGTGTATNSNTTTVTGAVVTGGTIGLQNSDATGASTVALIVDGDITVNSAAIGIVAGSANGANAILTVNGAGTNALDAVGLEDGGTGTGTGMAELVIGGSAAQTITGTIDGGDTGEGTLIVSNTSGGVTFSGAIGSTNSLRAIQAGVAGTTTTFNGAVSAATLDITGTGTVAFGTHDFTGNVAFGGNNGTVTLSSGIIAGNVTTTTNNTGTVTFTSGAGGVDGTIGAAGASLLAVNAGASGTTGLTGAVYAENLNVTGVGAVALGGTLTGTLAYSSNNGAVTLISGENIEGAVTATSAGTLTLGGTNTVTGAIGALNILNIAQSGGTATLGGTVAAATINVGTGVADFNGAVTGNINFGGNNGTVNVASGAGITGAVDSTVGASGTLDLKGGTQTVTGAVGSTNAITTIDAGQAGGTTTFDSSVKATTLSIGTGLVTVDGALHGTATFTGNGTLQIGAGQTFTGSVLNSTSGTGSLEFAGSGTMTTGLTDVFNAVTLEGTGNTVTLNGSITAPNTTNVGGNTLATTGSFSMTSGQALDATITGAGTSGKVAATGALSIPSGSIVDIQVSPSYTPAVGTFGGTYNIATGAGGGSVNSAVTIVSSPLYTFTQVTNANDLQVTAARNTIASTGSSANNSSVGAALDAIGMTGNAPLDAVQTDINAAPTRAALNNVLSSLTPTADGGAQESVREVGAAVMGIADTRMQDFREDQDLNGFSSGYIANGNSMWVQGYGQSATQDAQGGVAGYTATSVGGTVGLDSANIIDEGILGIMFNYGQSNIDSKNINTTKTTVDNIGVNLYGTGFLVDRMFLEWQAGYGSNKVDINRHNVGAAGIDADGSATMSEYDGRLALGKDYTVGWGTVFTPDVNTTYTRLNMGGYTETGPGANLNVSSNTQNELDLGVEAKIAWNLKSYYGTILRPMLHAGYTYAAVDDRVQTTSTFTGAAAGTDPAFVTTGPTPERSRFDLGAGFTYFTLENWDTSVNADYEHREDFHAYSGIIRATGHF